MSEIGSTAEISPQQVEELQGQMEKAHEAFSNNFHERKEREKELQQVAERRSSLVAGLSGLKDQLRDAIQEGIHAAGSGAAFSAAAREVAALKDEAQLLKQAISYCGAFDFNVAQRAVRLAMVAEKTSQLASENARLAHHEAKLHLVLATAAELDGGIQIQGGGPVSTGHREVIEQVSRDLAEARRLMHIHDTKAAVERDRYQKEYEIK